LDDLTKIVRRYLRLPLSEGNVPGAFLEGALAHVRGGERLNTYDFVDVINRKGKIGWQVKSTKSNTPLTWKRAKIADADRLVADSKKGGRHLQALGDAIIDFCNDHARASLELYDLTDIYYSRLVIFQDGKIRYVEKKLCDNRDHEIFRPADYTWAWSTPKKTVKKQQLPALHGTNINTGQKDWAWHGLGENQLHFSGEKKWWTESGSVTRDFTAPLDSEKLNLAQLASLLDSIKD
jgi:hypothetical protein